MGVGMMTKPMRPLGKDVLERLLGLSKGLLARANDGTLEAKSVKDLLSTESRRQKLRAIKRLCSVTEHVWVNHYLYSISKFAELVQELPASEIHHHSEKGGLLDHTLETLHAGLRIAQGYVMPPNAEPEKIASDAERWRFAVFVAILAHDIGKIVTDIEVIKSDRNDKWDQWHAWYGPIPVGARYKYRYNRSGDRGSSRGMHEKVSMSLVPRLITEKAAIWMFKDRELVGQFVSTVNSSTLGGHVIAEIVRAADRTSTAKNLGAGTGVGNDFTNTVPLQQKLIVSLRKLINDRDLKSNKPGAAVWVSETDTWVVSKSTMEAVRAQLVNEGHKGIPVNVVRLFDILKEHDLVVPNKEGDSIWWAEINYRPKNWKQKFTLLRFKNETLWPTSQPDSFDGTVKSENADGDWVVINGEFKTVEKGRAVESSEEIDEMAIDKTTGEIISTTSANEETVDQVDSNETPNESDQEEEAAQPITTEDKKPVEKMPVSKNAAQESKPSSGKKKASKAAPKKKNTANNEVADKDPPVKKKRQKKVSINQSAIANERILAANDFINWMLKGIQNKKIRVNEGKAEVHVLDGYIALVTPKIFERYLDENPMIRRKYRSQLQGGAPEYTAIQKEIQALGVNHIGEEGKNIHRLYVVGKRGASELRVYLIERRYLPSLNRFDVNKAMKIAK